MTSKFELSACSTLHAVHTPYSTKILGSCQEHLMQIALMQTSGQVNFKPLLGIAEIGTMVC
jgi:hypothetical protein